MADPSLPPPPSNPKYLAGAGDVRAGFVPNAVGGQHVRLKRILVPALDLFFYFYFWFHEEDNKHQENTEEEEQEK